MLKMGRESKAADHGQLTPESESPLLLPILNPGGEGRQSSRHSSSSPAATFMVVLTTLVAVSGSYVFGSAVGYSSPAQSGIMDDLHLSLAEYSVFGSILTIGAMLGAIMSGKLADLFGRKDHVVFGNFLFTGVVSNFVFKGFLVARLWKIFNGIWHRASLLCGTRLYSRNNT